MKSYQIRVNDREYQVEIADLTTRPVRVQVDGEWFEVWPGENTPSRPARETPSARVTPPVPDAAPRVGPVPVSSGKGTSSGSGDIRAVKAPLPGVVIAIHVQPGEAITAGQPLCVVEAMKMNNVVRANQAGQVAAVRVSVGQHVKHQDVLVELA